MFRRVEVPVLGVVENMSWYDCGDHRDYIFGEGGGARMAQTYSVELLGQLPLNTSIRQQADDGRPTVLAAPDRSEEHTSELQSLMRSPSAVFCLNKNNKP